MKLDASGGVDFKTPRFGLVMFNINGTKLSTIVSTKLTSCRIFKALSHNVAISLNIAQNSWHTQAQHHQNKRGHKILRVGARKNKSRVATQTTKFWHPKRNTFARTLACVTKVMNTLTHIKGNRSIYLWLSVQTVRTNLRYVNICRRFEVDPT